MQVDQKMVRHIARLARIQVDDDEVRQLEGELSGILDWVEQLGDVDTESVEPMTRVVAMTMKTRRDVADDGGYPEDIVANAPSRDDNYFMVPKVVE